MANPSTVNPELEQDRVFDLTDTFRKHGQAMFHQQEIIYGHLSRQLAGREVLEAGCGCGVGSARLGRTAESLIATDKLLRNVQFAGCIYPWMDFRVWNINHPTDLQADVVVAVEVLEHVEDPKRAIQNLLQAARKELWITTPNGLHKPRPPENPYHVCEYVIGEMVEMIGENCSGIVLWNWELWTPGASEVVDPVVYQVLL